MATKWCEYIDLKAVKVERYVYIVLRAVDLMFTLWVTPI